MITSFDYLNNPYESRRITSVANRGMVATGQPLASQVGLSILKQGGKKTYHTIIPGFLSKGNEPVGPFGVMGGFMQPQGHVQVVMNTVNFGLNPQAALDAPRWQWRKGKEVVVEADFPANTAEALSRKGHEISGELEHGGFGRGQIIFRDNKTGTLYGGTETRTEGTIAAY